MTMVGTITLAMIGGRGTPAESARAVIVLASADVHGPRTISVPNATIDGLREEMRTSWRTL